MRHTPCTSLDIENAVVVIQNVLPPDVYGEYLHHALLTERFSGKSAFNSMKPREEICYTVDGLPYNYSRIKQPTVVYPPHVLTIERILFQKFTEIVPENPFTVLSNGVDILYSEKQKFGGSIGVHSDDEMPWGLVLVYSIGQTRTFRIREKGLSGYKDFPLTDNSLVAMYGPTFQTRYTHQVDKLTPTFVEKYGVQNRLSLNIRYLRA
jgi:hypothetical protein